MKYSLLSELPELVSKKMISARRHATLPLTIYNYTVASQMTPPALWTEAMKDCRGLILDDDGEIIGRPLGRGKHVIVDDTNFAPKHEAALRECAKKRGAAFVVQDFTDVPLETCIERDRKRTNYVGEAVIRKMHTEYLAKPVPQVEHDPALPSCIICDIDGTVALMNGRGPYEENKVDTDLPNRPIVDLVRQLAKDNIIVFVSGRHEAAREKTEKWLADNVLSGCALFMRPDGDDRKDAIIKAEIYDREFRGKWNVRFTLDDRNRVVEFACIDNGTMITVTPPGDKRYRYRVLWNAVDRAVATSHATQAPALSQSTAEPTGNTGAR